MWHVRVLDSMLRKDTTWIIHESSCTHVMCEQIQRRTVQANPDLFDCFCIFVQQQASNDVMLNT